MYQTEGNIYIKKKTNKQGSNDFLCLPGRSLVAHHFRTGAAVVDVVSYLDHSRRGERIRCRGLDALGAPEAAQHLDGGDGC